MTGTACARVVVELVCRHAPEAVAKEADLND